MCFLFNFQSFKDCFQYCFPHSLPYTYHVSKEMSPPNTKVFEKSSVTTHFVAILGEFYFYAQKSKKWF